MLVARAMARVTSPDYSGPPLKEVQLRFVDKIEAFHQHIYATLAVLALVVNHLRDEREKQLYPVGSISKFLAALKERKFRYKDRLLDQVAILEKSSDFRSKYIDHPDQHQLHNWMTHFYLNKYHVVYFLTGGDPADIHAGDPDPDSPDFHPPIGGLLGFYVSPDLDRTYDAMQRVVMAALSIRPT
jgi:hypothetical protein